jgi:PAS domain-containing protein
MGSLDVLSRILGDWRAIRRWLAARPILWPISKSWVSDRLDGHRQALEDHFCITVTDCSGRLIEVNKRFCEVVGYSEAELLGQSYELLSSGEHAPQSLEDMWSIVNAGNRDGKIEQFITISTDITPIRQQAQTLQAMIDNFPGGIALVDREARLVSNRLYRTLLDLPDALFASGPPTCALGRSGAITERHFLSRKRSRTGSRPS